MSALPSDERIRARAHELGLVSSPSDPLPNAVRRRVARLLQDEAEVAATSASQQPTSQLLSRFTYETPAGMIRVDVTLTPHQEGTTDG